MECLLGRRMEEALALLAGEGIHPEIEKTGPDLAEEGTVRVVQVCNGGAVLRVSVFPTGKN